MASQNELQNFRDSIYDLIITYNLTFGEICGTFEDIKFSIWTEAENIEKNGDNGNDTFDT